MNTENPDMETLEETFSADGAEATDAGTMVVNACRREVVGRLLERSTQRRSSTGGPRWKRSAGFPTQRYSLTRSVAWEFACCSIATIEVGGKPWKKG